jgi:hypothetical protein
MKPTVGRIVHFYPPVDCVAGGQSKIEKYAAIVTQVNDDGTLELATFGPSSLYFQRSVPKLGLKHGDGNVAWEWGWAWPAKEGE